MNILLSIFITITIYIVALQIYKKSKLAILNPVLVTILIIVAGLVLLQIEYKEYGKDCEAITYMLSPIIIFLAVPIYKNREKIGANLIPITIGILFGIFTSVLSVYALGKLFKVDKKIVDSLYAKSITTPLAVEVTRMLNGIEGLTIVGVLVTGIAGATLAPVVMKAGKIKNKTAQGIGIGSASHGVGTSKAVEMSTEAGGASGLAMAITGVVTVLIASIFLK